MKKNLSLIIALSLPILMVIAVAISIYVSKKSINPRYDFLYTVKGGYDKPYFNIGVSNNRVTKSAAPQDPYWKDQLPEDPSLYIYDVKNNTNKQISYDEATKLRIDAGPQSPDGYTVDRGGSNSVIFYSSSNYNQFYIKNNSAAKAIDLGLDTASYYDYRFVGWILE